MAHKFVLKIFLDHTEAGAMSDAPAIAEALRRVADQLDSDYVGCEPVASVPITDNAKRLIGSWRVDA